MNKYCFLLLITAIPLSIPCRPEGEWKDPKGKDKKQGKDKSYFSPGESWGGWSPPKGNLEWKEWIKKWGKDRTTDRPESEEWDVNRGPGSGWPQHWKGYGLGIDGVPPPPWAYVPESYDKPQYCFHRPVFGFCLGNVTRWGFNPTTGKCQTFFYSGCGGNENNFIDKARCVSACIDTARGDCEIDPANKFEEMIDANPFNT